MKMFTYFFAVMMLSANSYAQLKFGDRAASPGLQLGDINKATSCDRDGLFLAAPTYGLGAFLINGTNINKFTSCYEGKSAAFGAERYSLTRCQQAIECKKMWDDSQADNINMVLNKIVAKDYGKNVLKQSIDSMESLEELKRFAFRKYSLMEKRCQNRFVLKGNESCRPELLVGIFENFQEKCSGGSSCFNKKLGGNDVVENYSDYKQALKKPKENSNFMLDFLYNRVNATNAKNLADDKVRMKKLSSLVASEHFKKATADQKMDLFFDEMGSDMLDKLNDPVLAIDFGSMLNTDLLKKTPKYKQLSDILSDKDLTKESFVEKFEGYRRNRVTEILQKGEFCENTKKMQNICIEVTGIADGKMLPKDATNADHISSKQVEQDSDYDRLKILASAKEGDEDKINMFIEAKRCTVFDLGSDRFSLNGKVIDPFGNIASSMTSGMVYDGHEKYSGTKDATREDSITNYIGQTGEYYTSKSDSSRSGSSSLGESTPGGDIQVHEESSEGLAGGFNNAISNQIPMNNYSSTFADSYNANQFGSTFVDQTALTQPDAKKDESTSSESSASGATASGAMNDKVNDLMKRLSAAEERVEKMKADSEAAEADRAKQKKIEEENALIKELRGQITDLKSQSKKEATVATTPVQTQEAQKSVASNYNSYSSSPVMGYTRGESVTAKSQSAENFDSGRSSQASPTSGSSISRSVASSSGAVLTSTSNNDGVKTTTLASGLVLTTIDGLTSEKATQTISNRIMELNGAPFYIEEGGLVKEIIPVVKDGKVLLDDKGNPIFEKIVKGKVGDKKFAKKGKEREPASITDAADLKRDQEEKVKRERAEYLKLKNITNGAINKK